MDELKEALEATGLPVAHFGWSKAPQGDYIVWGEDGANDLRANGRQAERVTELTVDLFTRDDSQTQRRAVEAALDSCGCAWYLNSAQLEDQSGYIHWEWVVQTNG